MVNSYLSFATTNEFKISYLRIGPTEIRLGFIVINTLIILLGQTHLARFLPWALVFSLIGLCVVVYQTQRHIWQLDMQQKTRDEESHDSNH